ncbi:MAG: hypothetical protein IKG85_00075 [Clostridia bacterium]|nr:hypothetical protein [Clostridia bacterium]
MARRRRKLVVRDRRKTALRMTAAIVSLIALIGAAVLTFFIVRSCGVKLTLRELPLLPTDMVCGVGDGLLSVRKNSLSFISYRDEDDDLTRALTGAAEPEGVVGTSGIRVVWAGNAVQIIDGNFDISVEGTIEAVRCGSSNVAVCMRLPNGDERVGVYTSAGQFLKSFDFPKGRLVDFGFSEASGSTLWTMDLDTDSGSPRTTISTFDLSRMSSTGVISVSGQLVERIFFTNSSVFVVGTESLIRYSSSANREIYRVRLYGYRVEDVSSSGDQPVLMLLPRGSASPAEAGSVILLSVSQKDVAGETAVTVILPEGTVGCHLLSGSLAAVGADAVRLYSPKGELLESLSLGASAVSARKLDERHILIERSGDLALLTVGK